ncbi:MAG: T9SS type A sorting domain-containing protein [Bacteroidetes bacterium]|nr:T9SS type A sorting domain-containing protein [Bacteroidota bacterium]
MKSKFTIKAAFIIIALFSIGSMQLKAQTWNQMDTLFADGIDAYDFSADGTNGTLGINWGYRYTNNSGSTWSPLKDATPYYAMFTSFTFFGNNSTVYAGTDRGFYDKSIDGGVNWISGPTLFAYTCKITGIEFSGNNGIVVTDEGEVAYTTDGDLTWTTLPARPHGSLSAIRYLEMLSPTVAYMGGLDWFMKTNDGGQTWTNFSNVIPAGNIKSISFSSVTNACAVVAPTSGPNQLWKTTDGGTSWTEITTLPIAANDICCATSNVFFATSNMTIYKSTDAGSTWTSDYTLASGFALRGVKISGNSAYSICSLFGGDKVLKNANAFASISENRLPESIKIFPMPATNQITIETDQLTKTNSISIFNIQGQELVKQEITNNSTTIDISDLSSGIYFVKYQNENGFTTQKMVKQ